MSEISNRFFVTALEDGTTLHGNLSSYPASLTQSWNPQNNTVVPNWSQPIPDPTTGEDLRPVIYLTLLNGAQLVAPKMTTYYVNDSTPYDYVWRYNGTPIVFDNNGISTSPIADTFQKTTKAVKLHPSDSTSVTMPALKLIGNLAGVQGNVDIDTITYEGKFDSGGSDIEFSATAQVRISRMEAGGYLGVVNFIGGISDITTQGQTITMWGQLYGGDNGSIVDTFSTKWYLNDATTGVNGTTLEGHTNAYSVSEGDIVDHAVVRCDFLVDGAVKYSAYVGIDDMQDPEFMYVQYNGANGNAASLRKGETATFQIWVGKREDPSVLGGTTTPTYGFIYVKLLDGDGAVATQTGLATSIPDPIGTTGYRKLTMSGGKGTITPHYDTVVQLGKNITGLIVAYNQKPQWDNT